MKINYSKEAEKLLDFVPKSFQLSSWDNIREEEPDEWDLKMLDEIKHNPECHEFTPESNIDWSSE